VKDAGAFPRRLLGGDNSTACHSASRFRLRSETRITPRVKTTGRLRCHPAAASSPSSTASGKLAQQPRPCRPARNNAWTAAQQKPRTGCAKLLASERSLLWRHRAGAQRDVFGALLRSGRVTSGMRHRKLRTKRLSPRQSQCTCLKRKASCSGAPR